MKNIKRIVSILIVLVFIFSQATCHEAYALGEDLFAKLKGSDQPVTVKGDKVVYAQEEKKVTGTGNVSITYGDVELTCDKITVYTDTKEAICEGNVKITQPNMKLEGNKINYNFTDKTGFVIDGDIKSKPFYGKADLVSQYGSEKAALYKGYITTCDLAKPSYRIEAKEIEIYFDRKLVAKHIVFYVKNVPILYLPLYVQPLSGKFPEVTVSPGRTSDWGYYILTAWRYYFNENAKGFIRLDYREKKGLAVGLDYQYKTKNFGTGLAKAYYTHENDALTIDKTGPVDNRWRLQYRHIMPLPEDTTFTMELNKMSDRDFIKDYLYREYEEDPNPDNYILFETSKPNYIFRVLARKRLNTFLTVTERLPDISLDVNNQRLWNTNFYYFAQNSATNFIKSYDEAVDLAPEEAIRVDDYNKLSYAAKLFNFLYTIPFIATRQTYYSQNKWKDPSQFRSIYEAGIEVSTRFFRVFDVTTNFWGLNINRLRHVINPSVQYLHRTDPTVSSEDLYQFDEIDAIEGYNGFQLSLEQKLQTKRKSGDTEESVDLARLVISTDYTFTMKKYSLETKGDGRFGDVVFNLDVNPYSWLSIYGDMTLDHKDLTVNTGNLDLYVSLGEKATLGLGHRYEHTEEGNTTQLTGELFYNINDEWKVKIYERFNFDSQKWEEQEYTVYKDLHSWIAEFSIDIRNGNDYTAWVVFKLKAFPDLPIGLFKTTYQRAEPGAKR